MPAGASPTSRARATWGGSLTPEAFDWGVKTMADFLIGLAGEKKKSVPQWDKLIFKA